MRKVFLFLLLAGVLGGVAVMPAQETLVKMQIVLPGGEATPEVLVREGSVMTLNSAEGTFGFWPTVRDRRTGLVSVVIRSGRRQEENILDEVEVVAGEPGVESDTSPVFRVVVIEVTER